MQVHHLDRQHPLFPKQLLQIPQPPGQLYAMGNLGLQDTLAVVGSRAVSEYGREVTNKLVSDVAWSNIVIVSGLALGVDGLAHKAALEAKGPTIAILPGGIERFYPRSHKRLGEEILRKGGLVLSEYEGHTTPRKHHFIARNRLIAGISKAVLITEAAAKSGSLHTAQFALEQGKDVMTVPGSIFHPNRVGCHNLIKEGAQLIQDSNDILNFFNTTRQKVLAVGDTAEEQVLLDLMSQGLATTNELFNHSQLDIKIFNQTLTMLEIAGKAKSRGQGQWSLP
jgi:DNA processing protein